jgi:hypothetical protein
MSISRRPSCDGMSSADSPGIMFESRIKKCSHVCWDTAGQVAADEAFNALKWSLLSYPVGFGSSWPPAILGAETWS